MFIAVLALVCVTAVFVCIGASAASVVDGRRKVGAWLLCFAGWVAVVGYAAKLAGLLGKPLDTSAPIPDWFMVPFCVAFLTLPITAPLAIGIADIWRDGGKNEDFALPFFEEESTIGFLYAVSLLLGFLLTDRFGSHYGWSFLISLPLLLVLFITIAAFYGGVGWLATRLARRFSPARPRAKSE